MKTETSSRFPTSLPPG